MEVWWDVTVHVFVCLASEFREAVGSLELPGSWLVQFRQADDCIHKSVVCTEAVSKCWEEKATGWFLEKIEL